MTKLKIAIAAGILAGGAAVAADVEPMNVAFDDYGAVEASLTGAPGNVDEGIKIYSSRSMGNCVACHQVSSLPDVAFPGEVGPSLDGVADRWNEAELRGIVADAKKTYDGTVMPSFYKTTGYIRPGNAYTGKAAEEPLPPILSAQQIEDVVAFLMTLKEE